LFAWCDRSFLNREERKGKKGDRISLLSVCLLGAIELFLNRKERKGKKGDRISLVSVCLWGAIDLFLNREDAKDTKGRGRKSDRIFYSVYLS